MYLTYFGQDNIDNNDLEKSFTNFKHNVLCFGFAGTGKSSFINYVTGSNLPTNHLRSCTKKIEIVDRTIRVLDFPLRIRFIDSQGTGDTDGIPNEETLL